MSGQVTVRGNISTIRISEAECPFCTYITRIVLPQDQDLVEWTCAHLDSERTRVLDGGDLVFKEKWEDKDV